MAIEDGYVKPADVDVLVRALKRDGFKDDVKATSARQDWSDHPETGGGSMSDPHPYRVLHTLVKDGVHVVVEQNTAHEPSINGVITYDAVVFITRAGQDLDVEERFSTHPVTDVEAVLEHADMCVEGVGARAPHETRYQRVAGAHQPQFTT